MPGTTHLLVIDPQNDFCDLPANALLAGYAPALPVTGAHADMLRLADFIRRAGNALDAITVTLDSHHRLHIAHPGFWQRAGGAAVQPFTTITAQQVRDGSITPRDGHQLPHALRYLDALDAGGKYTLMVWPVHCEIGSWGHNVHADVRAAYNAWESANLRTVQKVLKGSNLGTEHYSAIQAEVVDREDPATARNDALLAALGAADTLVVAGEASSHCVRATVYDLLQWLPGGRPERLLLLSDCMSPVTGFAAEHDAFLADMRARRVRVATSAQALDALQP